MIIIYNKKKWKFIFLNNNHVIKEILIYLKKWLKEDYLNNKILKFKINLIWVYIHLRYCTYLYKIFKGQHIYNYKDHQ